MSTEPPASTSRPRDTDESAPAHGDATAEDFARRGREVLDWIGRYLDGVPERAVLANVAPGEVLEALPQDGPEQPVPWNRTMAQLDELVLPAITHWNHPRFLAYFANSGSVPGILAAPIAAALNPNGMLWRTSPAVTELELRVVDWFRAWFGLTPGTFGIINDTASTSSLCALAAARENVPDYDRGQGLASLPGPARVYRSEHSHTSIDKAALLLGLGLDAVRAVPVDANYAMDAAALRQAIRDDRAAGRVPMCIVATLGTTSVASVDPIAEIAEVAHDEGVWLHADAAYAGAASIVPEQHGWFAGWERADSVVVNPHKWLFTPMCSSLLYTRHPQTLRAAFSVVPEYLRSDVGDEREALLPDLMNYGVQLGRPFRSLALWFVAQEYGLAGLRARIREHIRLARVVAERIDAHPDFERLAPTHFSLVCFRYRRGAGATGDGTELEPVEGDAHATANERLLAALNADGEIFLSHTRVRGRLTLRLAIGNIRTDAAAIDRAWHSIESTAARLLAQ